jgi:hypothetical protein
MPRAAHQSCEREELVLVEALERDGVDLDLEARGLRRVDALEHLRQAAPAGDLGEFRLVERVERDVHAAHARGVEVGREAVELGAVRGEGEFLERPRLEMARHGAEEGHDVPADERLAPGDAQLLHAHADEGRAEAVELLEREEVLLRQEGHVLGHAVDAAEVAAVRHRDPEVGDRAGEGVDKRRRHGEKVWRATPAAQGGSLHEGGGR